MKIKNHNKQVMTLTGSSVLKMIQEESMPNVDLLIRESLQNSLDAGKDDENSIFVDYIVNKFNSTLLASELDEIGDKINRTYGDKKYDYIAIKDGNTKGLLGTHILEKGKDNNLYNLVYDMMMTNKGSNSGGSWGIGKSVYYRFGIGLCFYYSRTFEDGKFKSKLCGALIEDENKKNRITKNDTGIAFFGDLDEQNNSMPIYDETMIENFLKIFNITPFVNDETGTIVIIPFVDLEKFLYEDEIKVPWQKNIDQSLKLSIQRWYFSRINNDNFKKGKVLIPFVNHNRVYLNNFFQILQNMYNLKDENSTIESIEHKDFSGSLGNFIYRIFTREDLINENNVFIPHNYYFGNYDDDDQNKGTIFYLRKPGMVLSYSSQEFNKIIISKDDFLIGMFVLNDDLTHENETLGQYFRNTEKASHTKWCNQKIEDFPFFSKKKPYNKIKKMIDSLLSEKFGERDEYVNDSSTSILKKKLGKLLLPPENFGNGASPITGNPQKRVLNKSKEKLYFDGFINGLMSFKLLLKLDPNYAVSFSTFVLANAKYSFENWKNLGFELPVKLHSFTIDNIKINNKELKLKVNPICFDSFKSKFLSINNNHILKCDGLKNSYDNYYGIKLANVYNETIICEYTLLIKPLDMTYSICVDTTWERGKK